MKDRDNAILAGLATPLAGAVRAILAEVNAKLPPGLLLRAFEGYRTPARQQKLYAKGTTAVSHGRHNCMPARACDLVFWLAGKWTWNTHLPWYLIGTAAAKQGVIWGGNWAVLVDRPHVELSGPLPKA